MTFCLSIHLLMDISVISNFCLLCVLENFAGTGRWVLPATSRKTETQVTQLQKTPLSFYLDGALRSGLQSEWPPQS